MSHRKEQGCPGATSPSPELEGPDYLGCPPLLGCGAGPVSTRLEPPPGTPTPCHPCSHFTLLLWPRGEQCGGCRRSNTTDRPHAFQVILADRPCLELSAESETEMADWMQHLCQAVSKGVSLSCFPLTWPPDPILGPLPKPTPVLEQPVRTKTEDTPGVDPGPQGHLWPGTLTVTPFPAIVLSGWSLPDFWREGLKGWLGPRSGELWCKTAPELQLSCFSRSFCQRPSGHPPGGIPQSLHPLLPGDHR